MSPERTTLAGGWNGETRRLPMPGGGLAEATIRDGGNCFNINSVADGQFATALTPRAAGVDQFTALLRSEEHTSELQSLMRISYAVFCLKKKKQQQTLHQ